MTPKQKLSELYPTALDIERDRQHYPSWAQMAKTIGVGIQALYDYRVSLKMATNKPKSIRPPASKSVRNKKETDITANIKALVGGESKNVVTKYKIVDHETYFKNPCGMDGLEFVGTEHGPNWQSILHLSPSAITY